MRRIATYITALALIVALPTLVTSCAEDGEDANHITVRIDQTEISYDEDGVWTDAMTPGTYIASQSVVFSHAGYSYYWSGFVASKNSDNSDYSSGDWLEHQYTAMPAGGISGIGTPYMVAYWNTMEEPGDEHSCQISYSTDGQLFTPVSAFVTNTSYAYYAMKNGTAYSSQFAAGDFCVLRAYGVTETGDITGPVELYLAEYDSDDDSPLSQWTYFNFEELGTVKSVFFRMESSDTGSWGMNTPAYFAIDRFSLLLQE